MFLDFEYKPRICNPEKSQVLTEIDGIEKSFIVLENENGDYIQAGGGNKLFTVEVRIYRDNDDFSHWKAEIRESANTSKMVLNISESEVIIQSNQAINRDLTKRLFESFFEGDYLSDIVSWKDISSMFS